MDRRKWVVVAVGIVLAAIGVIGVLAANYMGLQDRVVSGLDGSR